MFTKDVYSITATSKLTYKVKGVTSAPDHYAVVVSEDGETFTQIWSGTAETSVQEQELSLAEYAGKTLYLGFYHYTIDQPGDAIVLDNSYMSVEEQMAWFMERYEKIVNA